MDNADEPATTGTCAEAPGTHPALLTIDLDALSQNWRRYAALGTAEAAGVVKANGYGLGLVPTGRTLAAAGCRTFFVATLDEGVALSDALGDGPVIYVLNGFVPEARPSIAPDRLRPVLSTAADAAAWAAATEGTAAVALQVETGMNRLGIDARDWGAVAALGERLDARLILSHLACADGAADPAWTSCANTAQRAAFEAALAVLGPAYPNARASLAATAGALLGPDFAYDLLRPGVGLYGGEADPDARPVVTLTAPLMRLWDVPVGARSGYGHTWTAERPSRLGTIPLGYADGMPRALSNRGVLRLGDAPAPIAGRVSMDLTTVDLTDVPDAKRGDLVTVLGSDVTVGVLAAAADTIGYEILVRLGARARRRYVGGPADAGRG